MERKSWTPLRLPSWPRPIGVAFWLGALVEWWRIQDAKRDGLELIGPVIATAYLVVLVLPTLVLGLIGRGSRSRQSSAPPSWCWRAIRSGTGCRGGESGDRRAGLVEAHRPRVWFSPLAAGLDRLQRLQFGHAQDVDQRIQPDRGGEVSQLGAGVGDVVDGAMVSIFTHPEPPLGGTRTRIGTQTEYNRAARDGHSKRSDCGLIQLPGNLAHVTAVGWALRALAHATLAQFEIEQ